MDNIQISFLEEVYRYMAILISLLQYKSNTLNYKYLLYKLIKYSNYSNLL